MWILEAMTSIWLLQAVVVATGLAVATFRYHVSIWRRRGRAETRRSAIGEALS